MSQPERHGNIDLKLLRYFLAVAEELHFGRAAARLNMTQPPLSLHIKELETQLGTPLFIRHSRSVALTHAGRILMQEARTLLSSTHLALSRVTQIGRGERGCITLGVIGTALWSGLRQPLHRFLRENPCIDVMFNEQSPGAQITALEQHEIDAGIWRMATALPATLTGKLVCRDTFYVALPADHPFAGRESLALSDLKHEDFITLPMAHSDWRFLQQACHQAGFTPRIVREAVEPQTVLALVGMGMGVTMIAGSYADIHWPDITFRPLQDGIPADLYVVYDPHKIPPTALRLAEAIQSSAP